jgi:glycosyltransferase involved in cell wall biosynthesis
MNKNKITIVHIAIGHQPYDTRILYKQCITAANLGARVFFIVPSTKSETIFNVSIVPIDPIKKRLILKVFPLSIAAFRSARRIKADIYQIHEPWLLPVGLVLRALGKTVVYDAHENYSTGRFSNRFKYGFVRKIVKIIFVKLESLFASKMSWIFAATEEVRGNYPNYKVSLLRNFAVRSFFNNVKYERNLNNEFTLIYPGTLGRSRCIKEIIQSLPLINVPVKFCIIGGWNDVLYRDECMKESGWKYVSYLPYMPADQVYIKLLQADLGLQILYDNIDNRGPYPMKVFEYLASSLPILITNQKSKRSTFGSYVNYLDGNTPEKIAKKINELANNKEKLKKQGAAGLQLFENKFSWESESKTMLQVYNKFLQNKLPI